MKSLKTFVVKVAKEEYGHLALLALFDCVDDTKHLYKAVLQVSSSVYWPLATARLSFVSRKYNSM